MSEPIRLFYSYSHKDEELRNAFETHLSILKRLGTIDNWHDRKILPGGKWEDEIDDHITDADVVLLLISPDFIASDYCYGRELGRALERHEAGEAQVVPIIVRPVDWTGAPFAKLQALPKDGKAITTWANPDEAWKNASEGIRRLVESIVLSRVSMAPTSGPVQAGELLRDELSRIDALLTRPSLIGGASTGFHSLDLLTGGIHKSDIVLICGRPSMGKSDLALNIASQLTRETSLAVVFFSMRLPREQVVWQLLATESRISIHHIVRGFLMDSDIPKLMRAVGALAEILIFIDANTEYTEVELRRRIGKVKDSNQLGLVVVDGVDHLSSAQNYGIRHREVQAVVKALRKIAVDYEVPLVLTSTTAREGDLRTNKRPMIMDLGEWEPLAIDAANTVLILYRPDVYRPDGPGKEIAEINIAKNAYDHTGIVRLEYLSELCMFEDLPAQE